MSDAIVKRPSETVHQVFDFRAFVTSVAPASVDYTVRCEAGITAEDITETDNLIELLFSGGDAGRVYEFGVDAESTNGQSVVMTRLMRIREPAPWPQLVDGGQLDGPDGQLFLNGLALQFDGGALTYFVSEEDGDFALDGQLLINDAEIYFDGGVLIYTEATA